MVLWPIRLYPFLLYTTTSQNGNQPFRFILCLYRFFADAKHCILYNPFCFHVATIVGYIDTSKSAPFSLNNLIHVVDLSWWSATQPIPWNAIKKGSKQTCDIPVAYATHSSIRALIPLRFTHTAPFCI